MRGSSGHVDSKFEKLNERFDKLSKLLIGNQRQVAYMDKNQEGFFGYGNEDAVENKEETNYVGNQGGFNNNYKPFNNAHPNLSYRSTNVENPQDQVYPNQGQAFQPRPFNNTNAQARPQQGFNQPRGNFQGGFQPRGSNLQPQGATSSQPSQDLDVKTMFQSIMEGQVRGQQETERKFKEMQAQIDQVTSNVKSLNSQVAQLASSSQRTTSTLPGNYVTNPKAPCNVILKSEEDEKLVEAITLRSGIELPTREGANEEKLGVENNESIAIEPCLEKAKEKVSYDPPPYEPKIPFPGRVKKQLLEEQRKKFLEIVEKIEIDIPLLDAIKDNPRWKKFFKELITKSGKVMKGIRMEECKASNEASQPQAPPTSKTLVKKEHPGKFIIPCSIGGKKLDDALCDSGAFVNVISWDMVKELGLKGMKPNSTPLVFGDASKKIPKGILEDYPILVGNCIVPTDLLVLDMVDSKKQPLLLGAPFLTTVGAVIDYVEKVVVLKNVDDAVSYAMEPPNGFCGTITNGEATIELKEAAKVEYTSSLVMDMLEVDPKLENEVPLVETKLKEEVKAVEVDKGVKKKKLKKAKCELRESKPPSLTLKPLQLIDGKLECKVQCKGSSKPFTKARIILDPASKTKDDLGIVNAKMASLFHIKLDDRGPLQDGSPPTKA